MLRNPILKYGYLIALLFYGMQVQSQKASNPDSSLIRQIIAVENQFANDLNAHGAAFAFEKYAAPNAVIKRQNDTLIISPKEIGKYYGSENYKRAKAWWKPDHVEVSNDGSMAYTYGRYQWKFVNKAGKETEYQGVFHTVWKRQPDGSWKYTWD